MTFHVLNLPPTVQLCEIHILFTFITANAESQGDLPDLVANTCGLIYGISCTILDRGSYDIRFTATFPVAHVAGVERGRGLREREKEGGFGRG